MWAQLNICDQLWALVDSVSSNLFLTLFLFLSVLDLVQDLLIKIKKTVHGPSPWQGVHGPGPWKWSMDPVQRGGPWTPGPCFVLTRAKRLIRARKTTAKGLRNCSTFALGPISCCCSLSSLHWLHFSPTLSGKSPVSQRNTVNSTKGKLLVISK